MSVADAPRKLGKYILDAEIGRGSTGVVYLGHDPFIDRAVALKVALAEALRDAQSGERYRRAFFHEAHTAGRLRHPNILDIYDAGIDGDTCYIVMELVRGADTLRSYTRAERLLPVPQVVEIVHKCARALDYAHRQGVIHRDVKPSNILLTQDLDVKVADFSIAHVIKADYSQTLPLGFVGSPRYMSPEQIQEDFVTHQTDLFSLGVVTYEMLTGRHPFAAETFSRLVYRVVNDDPVPPSEVRPELPRALDDFVARALRKDPQLRYRDGVDMAADLGAAFSHLAPIVDEVPLRERFVEARNIAFFRDFPDAEIWEVSRMGIWSEHARGSRIVAEGDVESAFYVVVKGEVDVVKADVRLQRLGAGDCFGEMGCLVHARRTASIHAVTPVRLLKVSAQLLERFSKDCQLCFYRVLLATLVERLALTTDAVVAARRERG